MSLLLSGLNNEQLKAVTLQDQSALVLAGAGSGKTRVLTTRIAYLIQSRQVSPHSILAVTFTNKAAKEMLIRISAMLPINTQGMWVGTFHGLCNRMLRAHYQDAGLPQAFQILDSADQLAVIKRVLKDINADIEKFPPRQVQWFINNAKDGGIRGSQVEASDDFTRKMAEFYLVYEQQCNKEGVVDFAELLLRSYELLTRNEILQKHYSGRFSHILVDEFQDTSQLQYKWLRLLASAEASVFVVGDDDQSIYAFRGANTGNMKDFERDFNISEIIKLETLQGAEINDAKIILANHVTALCRGKEAAEQISITAKNTFNKLQNIEGIPNKNITNPTLSIVDALNILEFVSSNGEARRLIRGNGAKVNDILINDENFILSNNDYKDGKVKISSGKKKHGHLTFIN